MKWKKGTKVEWSFSEFNPRSPYPTYGEGVIVRNLTSAAESRDVEVEVEWPDHFKGQRFCFDTGEIVESNDA